MTALAHESPDVPAAAWALRRARELARQGYPTLPRPGRAAARRPLAGAVSARFARPDPTVSSPGAGAAPLPGSAARVMASPAPGARPVRGQALLPLGGSR